MNRASSAQVPRVKDRGRKARLAKALRENLKRRKAQLREREGTGPGKIEAGVPEDDESMRR